jgi:hypothetical protein
LVTRQDLLTLGFGTRSIQHRLESGRLHRVARGVYAVGWPQMHRKRRWMAAVLACGDGAVLSHRSAAALWGFGWECGGEVDVSLTRDREIRRLGIRSRTRPTLADRDVTTHEGIPLTQPVRTLIDIATEVTPRELERAVNEADKRDRVDPETLRSALDDHAGEPGVIALRDLLDRHTFRLSDDELELLFRPLAAAAGLPTPLTKQIVNDYEVDFHWPDLGLVIETDGLRYHRTASAQTRDAERDQIHTAVGLTPLRFSHYQVKYKPNHVRSILTRTRLRLER